MEKILWNIETGKGKMSDIDLLWDIQRKIEGNTICPLGDAAAWPVAAAIRHFRDEFEWHVLNPDECAKKKLWIGELCRAAEDGISLVSRNVRQGAKNATFMNENEIATLALDICFKIHKQ